MAANCFLVSPLELTLTIGRIDVLSPLSEIDDTTTREREPQEKEDNRQQPLQSDDMPAFVAAPRDREHGKKKSLDVQEKECMPE
jgi:hypothetical protein